MTWNKGESGNPGGRPSGALLGEVRAALRLEVMSGRGDQKRLRRICQKLIDLAEQGDTRAATLIFDRLEGKAPQSVDLHHSGELTTVDLLSDLARERVQHHKPQGEEDATKH